MKERMIGGAAWVLLAGGVSAADSECMLIPSMLAFVGSVLLLRLYH